MLHVICMVWFDIADTVYSKFGHTCKNVKYMYLTDLFSNLIPLIFDVYIVHHRGGD